MYAGLTKQPMEHKLIFVGTICTSLPFLLARRACARISSSTLVHYSLLRLGLDFEVDESIR